MTLQIITEPGAPAPDPGRWDAFWAIIVTACLFSLGGLVWLTLR